MLRSITLSFLASSAAAAPQVVTDIAPVHSLVAQVMDGVGVPHLLVRPGASPHSYALRPSDASAMQGADVVVWVGEALSPWLADPVSLFAEDAKVIELMGILGTTVLKNREEHDDHDDHEDGDHHDGHDHSDHAHGDDHGHDEAKEHTEGHDHDDHGHADHGHDHHHGVYDPHLWLDPMNASAWVGEIAVQLAQVDPENAALYASNAKATQARLDALDKAVATQLAGVQSHTYVAVHDAFQYFDARYGLKFAGSITGSDDVAPGAGGLADLTKHLVDAGVTCAIQEPGSNARWIDALLPNGKGAVATVSPLGVEYEAGPMLYASLIQGLGNSFEVCLGQ